LKKIILAQLFLSTLPNESNSDGILRVLIEDQNNTPLAERLVFRKPSDQISLEIVPNYKSYSPGDPVKVTVKAKNQDGKPVTCYTSISVVDETVLEQVEKRKQEPRLPCMVYLEQEVDHLEDANIYFSEDPKSDLAIDLLLGTQGWRRFAFESFGFVSKHLEKGERVLGQHQGIPIEDKLRKIEIEDEETNMLFAIDFDGMIPELNMVQHERMEMKLEVKEVVKKEKKEVVMRDKKVDKKVEIKEEKKVDKKVEIKEEKKSR